MFLDLLASPKTRSSCSVRSEWHWILQCQAKAVSITLQSSLAQQCLHFAVVVFQSGQLFAIPGEVKSFRCFWATWWREWSWDGLSCWACTSCSKCSPFQGRKPKQANRLQALSRQESISECLCQIAALSYRGSNERDRSKWSQREIKYLNGDPLCPRSAREHNSAMSLVQAGAHF